MWKPRIQKGDGHSSEKYLNTDEKHLCVKIEGRRVKLRIEKKRKVQEKAQMLEVNLVTERRIE